MKTTLQVYVDEDDITDAAIDATSDLGGDATDEAVEAADKRAEVLEDILKDYLNEDSQLHFEIDDETKIVTLVKPSRAEVVPPTPTAPKAVFPPALNITSGTPTLNRF